MTDKEFQDTLDAITGDIVANQHCVELTPKQPFITAVVTGDYKHTHYAVDDIMKQHGYGLWSIRKYAEEDDNIIYSDYYTAERIYVPLSFKYFWEHEQEIKNCLR